MEETLPLEPPARVDAHKHARGQPRGRILAPRFHLIALLCASVGAAPVSGHHRGLWTTGSFEPGYDVASLDELPGGVPDNVPDEVPDEIPGCISECSVALLQMQARFKPSEAAVSHDVETDGLGLGSLERQQDRPPSWTYADAASWPDQFPGCAAGLQSPIDISAEALGFLDGSSVRSEESLCAHYHDVKGSSLAIKNGGHSVQVAGEFGSLRLPHGNYVARLFHFHFPAEHAIYGEFAAGELHIVHQLVGATDMEGLAVIAIQLREAEQLDLNSATKAQIKFLEDLGFPDRLPSPGEEIPLAANISIDLGRIFGEELSGPYYHYQGSLTSPPCPGHAHWYVLQNAAAVDSRMIEKFKSLFPSHLNNRPLQPLAGRKVAISKLALGRSEFARRPS